MGKNIPNVNVSSGKIHIRNGSLMEYQLLDSGEGQRLEQLGPYRVVRPAMQAAWRPMLPQQQWHNADAIFTREQGNEWKGRSSLPAQWVVALKGYPFIVSLTDFGHIGLFPEHATFWSWMSKKLADAKERRRTPPSVLNLFAYSGGATIACAAAGAFVCHVDASKGMVSWARENGEKNGLRDAPIRWIVDDAGKFVQREKKRGRTYDAILLDPPSFGRGPKGEVFKIENDLVPLLQDCRALLSEKPLFFLLTSHTPGYTPLVLHHLLQQQFCKETIEAGEMAISPKEGFSLPSGVFARVEYVV